MLLPNDISPKNSIYYTGAMLLESINKSVDNNFEFFELYQEMQKNHLISWQLFIFSIDWLYLLGSIRFDQKGRIEKCF
jgi:hypothetical protein